MLDQLEVRLKLSFWLHVCILCCMLLFLININCFGQKRKKLPTDEARNFIISEKINDAIV